MKHKPMIPTIVRANDSFTMLFLQKECENEREKDDTNKEIKEK